VGINKALLEEDDKLDKREYPSLKQTRDLYSSCYCEAYEQNISDSLISNDQRDLWARMLHFVKAPLYALLAEHEESLLANANDSDELQE